MDGHEADRLIALLARRKLQAIIPTAAIPAAAIPAEVTRLPTIMLTLLNLTTFLDLTDAHP